jgi:glycosyltransferase involved in cell wall biosynthesis
VILPEVSIIVPVFNAADTLPQLLDSLAAQSWMGRFEVVVADNRSTDCFRAIVERYASDLNIFVADASAIRGRAYARNIGATLASTRKLLFVDADDALEREYVENMSHALDQFPYVGSRVDSTRLNPPWTLRPYGTWQVRGFGDFFGFLPCAGSNCGVTRELFEELGGWPETYSGAEDIALGWLVQLGGHELHFETRAVYLYRHRQELRGIFRQFIKWGGQAPLLYKDFHQVGMPARSVRESLKMWRATIRDMVHARSRSDWAWVVGQVGQILGRVGGSIRHRVLYL